MSQTTYEVNISKTSAPSPSKLNTDEHWQYDHEEKEFDSFDELEDFIDRMYPDSGKEMFRGSDNPEQTGWIFNFWQNSYREEGKHYEQHWVEIEKVQRHRTENNGKSKRIEEREYLSEENLRKLAKKSS